MTLRNDAGLTDDQVKDRTQVAVLILSIAGIVFFILCLVFVSVQIVEFIKEYRRKKMIEKEERERLENGEIKSSELNEGRPADTDSNAI
jgi:uncharacterized membrane protein